MNLASVSRRGFHGSLVYDSRKMGDILFFQSHVYGPTHIRPGLSDPITSTTKSWASLRLASESKVAGLLGYIDHC